MGYILPIQMDAYTQYANRIATSKEYIKLNPVNKTTFYPVDSKYSWSEIQKNNPSASYSLNKKQNKAEAKSSVISDKLLSEITGKGRFINEFA